MPDYLTPMLRTMLGFSELDRSNATALDTRALAQQRMLATDQLRDQIARQKVMADILQRSAFSNPTAVGGPAGNVVAPGQPLNATPVNNPFELQDNDPLMESRRNAQEGVVRNKQLMAAATAAGDVKTYQEASKNYDEQQAQLRQANNDITKEAERRMKEASQVFGMVQTPEDLQNATQYLVDNFGKRQAAPIVAQLAKSLPGGIAGSSPEQIQAAVAPIVNRFVTGGDQYRQLSAIENAKARNEANRIAEKRADQAAARTQAGITGVEGEELTPGGKEVLAEAARKGISIAGGSGLRGSALRITTANQIAADMDKEGAPYSSIGQERIDYRTQGATQKDFTSGPTARNITAINTSLGHLQSLEDLSKALNSSDVKAVNRVVNFIADQFGDPRINNARTAGQAVSEELMRTFRVVGASVTEQREWEEKIKVAQQSPEQMEGFIKTAADLLRSRLEALDEQWKRGMKTDKGFPDIITPKNQAFLGDLGIKYDVTRPDGSKRAPAEAAKDTAGQIPAGAQPAPAAAIEHLKAHPELKDAFKRKYGYLPAL